MKRIILYLAFIIASVCPCLGYDITNGNFSFNILSENEATVVLAKADPNSGSTEMNIPSTVFHNGKSYTVTRIGERAINLFYTYFSITVPNTVQVIEDYGIASCFHLYLIEFEEGEKPITIGRGVLNSCGDLEQAVVYRQFIYDENVTTKPFAGKKKLDSVFLGGSWHNISEREFVGCSELTYISLHSDIYSIGAYAFQNCPKFSQFVDGGYYEQGYDYMEKLLEIGEYAFSGTAMRNFTFSDSLTCIPNRLFYNCPSLKNVYFPDNCIIEEIGVGAFMNCTALESITIPTSIKTINDISFAGCSSLKTYKILDGKEPIAFINGNYTSENFQDTPIKELYIGRNFTGDPFDENTALETITLGNGVTELPLYSFRNCPSLKNIKWGEALENISSYSFENCVSLESIALPLSIKRLGVKVFSGCSNLKTVLLNEGLQFVYSGCFSGASISSINIPSTVEIVDEYAFADCPNLTDVIFIGKANSPELRCARYSFHNTPAVHFSIDRLLRTPYNSSGRYYDNLFTDNTTFKSVEFGPNSKAIGSYTFYNCASLENVEISEGVETISSFAFYNTSNLKSIEFPSTLKEIGDINFNYCTNLTTIKFADCEKPVKLGYSNSSYNKQGEGLFYGCPITDIYLGRDLEYDSTYKCGFSPFYGIKTLKKVTFSDNVNQIPNSLFQGCEGLDSIKMSSTTGIIKDNAFNGCNSILSIEIPNSVTYIGNGVFSGCNGLTSITIGSNVTDIGNNVFCDCAALKSIKCTNAEPPKVGMFTLSQYQNVILYVPIGSLSAYQSADVWKEFNNIEEFNVTGIDKIDANGIDIEVTANGISLSDANGKAVAIYSANGTIIEKKDTYTGEEIMLDKGIHIVRVGNKSIKVKI